MSKKWWILAMVAMLAFGLTGCTKKKATSLTYGAAECGGEGTVGLFELYVIPMAERPGMYELSIIPQAIDSSVASFQAVIGSSQSAYPLLTDFTITSADEIILGQITESQLYSYDAISIGAYQPGTSLTSADGSTDAVCTLPELDQVAGN